jgi:hypothetical protein
MINNSIQGSNILKQKNNKSKERKSKRREIQSQKKKRGSLNMDKKVV